MTKHVICKEVNGVRIHDDSIFPLDYSNVRSGDFVIKKDGIYMSYDGELYFYDVLENLWNFYEGLKNE